MIKVFQKKGAARLFCALTLALSLLCIVARLLALLFDFEIEIGYYQRGSVLGTVATVLPAVCAVAAAVFSFAYPVKVSVSAPRACLGAKICSAVLFAAFLFTLVISAEPILYGGFTVKAIVTALCYILSAVFFLLVALDKKTTSPLYVICGTAVIVWLVLALGESYFDSFVQMNSPIKLSFQFGILSAMLLTVCELRAPFNDSRKQAHLFSASMATVFCGTSAIPSIICYACGKMPDTYYLLAYDCVLCLFFALAVSRLIQLCSVTDETAEVSVEEPRHNVIQEDVDTCDNCGGDL